MTKLILQRAAVQATGAVRQGTSHDIGCFLSTMTSRDCAEDCMLLWLCRVRERHERHHGKQPRGGLHREVRADDTRSSELDLTVRRQFDGAQETGRWHREQPKLGAGAVERG